MVLEKYINRFYQVDAFTSEPFKGNPAGIMICKSSTSTDFMQKMAAEINLPETAFIYEIDHALHVRFFTPETEIPLCGHATLAAAHVLFEKGIMSQNSPLKLSSQRHLLEAEKTEDGKIRLKLPLYTFEKSDRLKEFNNVSGIRCDELYKTEHGWYMAILNTEEEIMRLNPHLQHMKHSDFGQVIVSAPARKDQSVDYFVRCFVPGFGIDEDPVTGSAQCALAPYWSRKKRKNNFEVYQSSRRGGKLTVAVHSDYLFLSGNAVTLFEGNVLFDHLNEI